MGMPRENFPNLTSLGGGPDAAATGTAAMGGAAETVAAGFSAGASAQATTIDKASADRAAAMWWMTACLKVDSPSGFRATGPGHLKSGSRPAPGRGIRQLKAGDPGSGAAIGVCCVQRQGYLSCRFKPLHY
jgi:hypothetical protein